MRAQRLLCPLFASLFIALLTVSVLLSARTALAQSPESGATDPADLDPKDSWTFSLYIENDLFSRDDQQYTSGVRFSWVSPDLTDYIQDPQLPSWLRSLNRRLTFFHQTTDGLQRNLAVSLGQTIYTPEDRDTAFLVEEDRPYAGWLFSSFAYHSKTRRQLDTLELQLGIVGPSALGQDTQDFIHKMRGLEKFKGWDHQLKDEIGLMLLYEHKQKISDRVPENGDLGFDIITHAGAALGNVGTYVNAGIEFRLGWLIPNDFGTAAVRPGGDNNAPGGHWDPRINYADRWGFHFFASFDGRAVARDIFLDGNSFNHSHSVDKEILVGDLSVGVSTVFHGLKLSYAQVFRTREFKQQRASHAYGSLAVSFSF